MDNRKIRVAITQGDANGVGFELIFKTFIEPEMLELCTPIVYGSPKVASYHSKALNIHCPFSIINNIEDTRDDRVNLLVCHDEDIKVEFGKCTAESAIPAIKAVAAAVDDCQKGLADILVCGPVNDRIIQAGNAGQVSLDDCVCRLIDKAGQSLRIYQNDLIRMTVASKGTIKNVGDYINKENISSKIRALHAALKRDFLLDNPRIAVLALNLVDDTEENEVIKPAIQELTQEDIQVFGPYKSCNFFAGRDYEAFDGILAMYQEQAMLAMRMLTDIETVAVQTGLPIVCTMPDCDAQMPLAGKGKANASLLRNAIYAGIDMLRARHSYDEASAHPLKKLYKDHVDNSEKPYSSQTKKKE